MLFSLMPLNVFAAGSTESAVYTGQENEAETGITNDDLTVSGNNSFGNLLANEINRSSGNQSSPAEGYYVTGIEMDGKKAIVGFNAAESCSLVVAVYTDDGIKMLGSGKTTVSAENKTAEVTVSIDTMPKYYLVKAFLVNPENNYPLSNVFTSELYTQGIQEVKDSTIDDYEDREVLNLDSSDDTNFAVYSKTVNVIDPSVGSNVYQESTSDPDNGKYVFANADSSFTSMKAGSIFSYENDGQLIIVKVKSIEVKTNANGTKTVTVWEDSNIEMSEVFDYVKIENDGKIDSYELDDSTADAGLTDISSPSSGGQINQYQSLSAGSKAAPKSAGVSVEGSKDFVDIQKHINKKKSNDEGYVELDADFKLKMTMTVTAYASFENCYVDVSINTNATLNGFVTGSYALDITLPTVSARFAGGSVKVGFVPKLQFSASAKITFDASFTYKVGFNCSTTDGLVNTSDDKPTFTLNVKVEGEIYFGLDLNPSVTFIEAGVGKTKHYLAKLNVPMEIGLKTTGVLESPSDHACQKCIDGDFYFHIKVSPAVKLLVKESMGSVQCKKEHSKTLLEKDPKVGDWYYSFDKSMRRGHYLHAV